MDIIKMFINKVSEEIIKQEETSESNIETNKIKSVTNIDTNQIDIKGDIMSKVKLNDVVLKVLEENPELEISKDAALTLSKVLFEKILDEVANGTAVNIYKFGTFEPRFQKGREGFNNAIKKPFKCEDKYVPKFEASDVFKAKVAETCGK